MNTQKFTHEAAEKALASIYQSIPLDVKSHIVDIEYSGKYQYSCIGFGLEDEHGSYKSVCTASTVQELEDIAKFIELMTGFDYPPMPPEEPNSGYVDLSVSQAKMARLFQPVEFDEMPF